MSLFVCLFSPRCRTKTSRKKITRRRCLFCFLVFFSLPQCRDIMTWGSFLLLVVMFVLIRSCEILQVHLRICRSLQWAMYVGLFCRCWDRIEALKLLFMCVKPAQTPGKLFLFRVLLRIRGSLPPGHFDREEGQFSTFFLTERPRGNILLFFR